MGQILKTANDVSPLNKNGNMNVPAMLIPSFRTHHAVENKIDKNFLIRAYGGLGDQACAEPSIRYALKYFNDSEISVESLNPELFQHLPLKGNFNEMNLTDKDRDKYFVFQSMYDSGHLSWEFMCHMIVHCVDYPALNMWRAQIPIQEKSIILVPNETQKMAASFINPNTDVVIHAGKNWQSKTMPNEFWQTVIDVLVSKSFRPILIGGGTVFHKNATLEDLKTDDCVDFRNRLSVMETTAVLQKARVVLTNDSGPLHLAASGKAWIGFVSTVKHPDFITHWRKDRNGWVQWGWRMENHSLGGMWETMNINPNNAAEIYFNTVDEDLLRSWLPDPFKYAEWAMEKMNVIY